MSYTKEMDAPAVNMLTEEILTQFRAIAGKEYVLVDDDQKSPYAHDKTEKYFFMPDVVVKPRTPEEVSLILKICHAHRIPVTPRGAGTGLAGGSLPVKRGVVLSLERFNQILQIDELNLQATVEPGVITEVFQN